MPRAQHIYTHALTGKLPSTVADGLLMYSTAYCLYDVLVRINNPGVDYSGDVLRHARQPGWLGRNEVYLHFPCVTFLLYLYAVPQAIGRLACLLHQLYQARAARINLYSAAPVLVSTAASRYRRRNCKRGGHDRKDNKGFNDSQKYRCCRFLYLRYEESMFSVPRLSFASSLTFSSNQRAI